MELNRVFFIPKAEVNGRKSMVIDPDKDYGWLAEWPNAVGC